MKKIAAFLLVLIGLAVVVFYFEPAEPTSSADNLAIYQMNPSSSEVISTILKKEEMKTTKMTTTNIPNTPKASQEEAQFYDTKSDPSIQPIDPDTDPANEIKKL